MLGLYHYMVLGLAISYNAEYTCHIKDTLEASVISPPTFPIAVRAPSFLRDTILWKCFLVFPYTFWGGIKLFEFDFFF